MFLFVSQSIAANQSSALKYLGKSIFFDTELSNPPGQSCASCHVQANGFTGAASHADNLGAVEPGAVSGRFGNRKSPTIAYAAFSPAFHYDPKEKLYMGGQFWDGRANTLEDQASQPFINPLEMNNPSLKEVCLKVANGPYANLFKENFGEDLNCSGDGTTGMTKIVTALAAFERSKEMNPFTSKYDYYLQGKAQLTNLERQGMELFNAEKKGNCAACHPSEIQKNGAPPMFTDFTYDNLGLPANPENPFLSQSLTYNPMGSVWKDKGLGAIVEDPSLDGAFKVPTLRNVALVPSKAFKRAYGHNGMLKSLKEVVRFYNTRDVKGAGWPVPEFPTSMNVEELGNLHLTGLEEDAIVQFLQTLNDGFDPISGKYPE